GYGKYYVALKKAIEAECSDVAVTEIRDPGATGNFEVIVNGKLVHSKKTLGHDRCESSTTTQKVIDAVNDA
ncbi:hypothetical protein M885DRAFT_444867, partial [Pelagophyceae sp. CCMP2097]